MTNIQELVREWIQSTFLWSHNIMTNNKPTYDKWVLANLNSSKEANSMLQPLASNAVINCVAFFIR